MATPHNIASSIMTLTSRPVRSGCVQGTGPLGVHMIPFGDHLSLIQAYVGGLFREQGLDVVKRWLDPLFRPLIDHGYEAERREHLVPGAAVPATTCSPPPQSAAPTPSPPGRAAEVAGQTNTVRLRAMTTRNSPVQTPSVASPPQRETDRPNIGRKRRGDSMREGGSRDAGKTSS
jgi:hypothetical protein